MSDFNINNRLKLIEDLDCFIEEKRKFLVNVLNKLCWTEESLESEVKVQCPINSGHWIPKSCLDKHTEMCAWVIEGYLKEEQDKQPPSSKFFYGNSTSVVPVIIDKKLQETILSECNEGRVFDEKSEASVLNIPKTIDRCTVEMTPQQRLAMYDYVVSAGKALNKRTNVKMEDLLFDFEKKNGNDEKPKTQLELLAEQRDYKRRRQSYRAKNVHITKKSYTEVMKEVIENQITYLAETRKQEDAEARDIGGGVDSTADAAGPKREKRRKIIESSPRERETWSDIKEGSRHHRSRRSSSDDRSGSSSKSYMKHKKSRSRSKSRHKHKKSHHKKHKKSH